MTVRTNPIMNMVQNLSSSEPGRNRINPVVFKNVRSS